MANIDGAQRAQDEGIWTELQAATEPASDEGGTDDLVVASENAVLLETAASVDC
jgi:hypothetical protein